jgi:putative flippase GtrA
MAIPQLLRFLTVGGTTFIIYFALQYAFERLGCSPYVALSIAYLIAITWHYLMNRAYTFQHKLVLEGTPTSLAKYAVVNVIHYFITLAIVSVTTSLHLNIRVGMVISIGVTTITGYLLFRHWVFKT